MPAASDANANPTAVEARGDRELVVTRSFDAPPRIVFAAWTRPELFIKWWMPGSVSGVALLACEMDVRTGGGYRLEFGVPGGDSMAFYGRYLEVVADARLVWTNEEGEDGAVTTVTFEAVGDATLLTFYELYPTAAARDEAFAGSAAAMPEQLDQLTALLGEPAA
jgi:uncharacterized protein YndB with AHSA1/START domain